MILPYLEFQNFRITYRNWHRRNIEHSKHPDAIVTTIQPLQQTINVCLRALQVSAKFSSINQIIIYQQNNKKFILTEWGGSRKFSDNKKIPPVSLPIKSFNHVCIVISYSLFSWCNILDGSSVRNLARQ